MATINVAHSFRGLRRRSADGDDGLTSPERTQRADRYFETAGRKSSEAEMDALEARMTARHEAESRHTKA